MNKEQTALHALLENEVSLPDGWICEQAFPWKDGTHLVAPQRSGGVVVRERRVRVQLPGDIGDVCADHVHVTDGESGEEFKGRQWRSRIVVAAERAVWSLSELSKFRDDNGPMAHRNVDYNELTGRSEEEAYYDTPKGAYTDWKLSSEMGWPGEQFQMLTSVWSIDEAKRLLMARPRKPISVKTESLKDLIQNDNPSTIQLFRINVDWDKVKADDCKIDLSVPLICGWVEKSSDEGGHFAMIMDGHHRIARAVHLGVEELTYVMLDKDESKQIHRRAR